MKSYWQRLCLYLIENINIGRCIKFFLIAIGACFSVYALVCSIYANTLSEDTGLSLLLPDSAIEYANRQIKANQAPIALTSKKLDQLAQQLPALKSDSTTPSEIRFLILVDITGSNEFPLGNHSHLKEMRNDMTARYNLKISEGINKLLARDTLYTVLLSKYIVSFLQTKYKNQGNYKISVGFITGENKGKQVYYVSPEGGVKWENLENYSIKKITTSGIPEGGNTDFTGAINECSRQFFGCKGCECDQCKICVYVISDFLNESENNPSHIYNQLTDKLKELNSFYKLHQLTAIHLPTKDPEKGQPVINSFNNVFRFDDKLRVLDLREWEEEPLDKFNKSLVPSYESQLREVLTLPNFDRQSPMIFYYDKDPLESEAYISLHSKPKGNEYDKLFFSLFSNSRETDQKTRLIYTTVDSSYNPLEKEDKQCKINEFGCANYAINRKLKLDLRLPINYHLSTLSMQFYNEQWKQKLIFPIELQRRIPLQNAKLILYSAWFVRVLFWLLILFILLVLFLLGEQRVLMSNHYVILNPCWQHRIILTSWKLIHSEKGNIFYVNKFHSSKWIQLSQTDSGYTYSTQLLKLIDNPRDLIEYLTGYNKKSDLDQKIKIILQFLKQEFHYTSERFVQELEKVKTPESKRYTYILEIANEIFGNDKNLESNEDRYGKENKDKGSNEDEDNDEQTK
ncbi:MAG: hypothetical protein CMI35_12485 [Owenweeksia sp.]|nr:hypothetical protein [Owenweeksia sp.]|tara:strand:+ start:382 stop:2433 length:2052 start_codon:yes stop_codon:yes gene_type:complete